MFKQEQNILSHWGSQALLNTSNYKLRKHKGLKTHNKQKMGRCWEGQMGNTAI